MSEAMQRAMEAARSRWEPPGNLGPRKAERELLRCALDLVARAERDSAAGIAAAPAVRAESRRAVSDALAVAGGLDGGDEHRNMQMVLAFMQSLDAERIAQEDAASGCSRCRGGGRRVRQQCVLCGGGAWRERAEQFEREWGAPLMALECLALATALRDEAVDFMRTWRARRMRAIMRSFDDQEHRELVRLAGLQAYEEWSAADDEGWPTFDAAGCPTQRCKDTFARDVLECHPDTLPSGMAEPDWRERLEPAAFPEGRAQAPARAARRGRPVITVVDRGATRAAGQRARDGAVKGGGAAADGDGGAEVQLRMLGQRHQWALRAADQFHFQWLQQVKIVQRVGSFCFEYDADWITLIPLPRRNDMQPGVLKYEVSPEFEVQKGGASRG